MTPQGVNNCRILKGRRLKRWYHIVKMNKISMNGSNTTETKLNLVLRAPSELPVSTHKVYPTEAARLIDHTDLQRTQ